MRLLPNDFVLIRSALRRLWSKARIKNSWLSAECMREWWLRPIGTRFNAKGTNGNEARNSCAGDQCVQFILALRVTTGHYHPAIWPNARFIDQIESITNYLDAEWAV
jgi:hypothetical protein